MLVTAELEEERTVHEAREDRYDGTMRYRRSGRSGLDLPMLSLVGHPVAINPDRRLSALAEEEDWQVRDFRTGRRAARVGLLSAAGAGALAGGIAATIAVTRHLRR